MDKLYLKPDYDFVTGPRIRKVIDSIKIYSYIYIYIYTSMGNV
jgi:hypothetical protein